MHHQRHLCLGVLALATLTAMGCATTNTPPDRKWPSETPGSYPGTTHSTRNGEWWFPSQIGPKAIPAEGGNRGTIFFVKGEEPVRLQVVTRTVYKPRFVDKQVLVERVFFTLITFDENSAQLDADAQLQVDQAAALIAKARGYTIIVGGHRDVGEQAAVDDTRAEAVRKALMARGVDGQRLTAQAYDDTRLPSRTDTALAHELARRVDFTFLPANLDLAPQAPADDPMPPADPSIRVETVERAITVERPVLVYKDRVIFPNILFDYDKATLRPDAKPRADFAAAIVQAMDHVKSVTVVGHTDGKGGHAYNDQLSLRRATTVRDHMVEQGVPGGRVAAEGRGKRQPIATNDTDEGRQLNRRVEFEVAYED